MTSALLSEGIASPRPSQWTAALSPTGREAFVIGAGGHGKVVVSALLEAQVKVTGIYDDDLTIRGTDILGVPVLGVAHDLHDPIGGVWVIAVGDNFVRHQLAARFHSAVWMTVIHPRAYVHEPKIRS